MPYQAGKSLPGERASKLGHLDVLKSPLVQQIVQNFEQPDAVDLNITANWEIFPEPVQPLDIVFAVDGSLQPEIDERPPHKALTFVKTALMKIDQVALKRIDGETPHPFAVRDLMSEAALYHATVFPLRYVHTTGLSVYDAVRQIIHESVKDASLGGEVMETLKWLAFEKWSPTPRSSLPPFQCPHIEIDGVTHDTTLILNSEEGKCSVCGKTIFITDMLGFHLEMSENTASDSVATAYMNIHETLLLFSGIRHFWESNRETLKRCLFLKDGPLQIRAQYSKLVAPIRNFLAYAYSEGYPISLVGQEKTGTFVDHLNLVGKSAPANHIFIPDHVYICEQIQSRPPSGAPYGRDTNYGAKVFAILNERCRVVLTVPVKSGNMGRFIQNPNLSDLINLNAILATLPSMVSSRHENALLPIELAHSIASLSTYPSAKVLQLFADANIKRV